VFLNFIDDESGRWILFIVLAIFNFLAWIFVFFFVPETIGKTTRQNLKTMIGKEALDRHRKRLRKEYNIKDVDVHTKNKVVKDDLNNEREPYKLQT
jgi:hypothetical protein